MTARITAFNSVGSSGQSPVGNGAVLFLSTVPAEPTLITDPTTNRSNIKITWTDGATGGQPILDYKLWYD